MSDMEEETFLNVKRHLPGVSPFVKNFHVFLQLTGIIFTRYICVDNAVICEKTYWRWNPLGQIIQVDEEMFKMFKIGGGNVMV